MRIYRIAYIVPGEGFISWTEGSDFRVRYLERKGYKIVSKIAIKE